jgi:hypothetical protein
MLLSLKCLAEISSVNLPAPALVITVCLCDCLDILFVCEAGCLCRRLSLSVLQTVTSHLPRQHPGSASAVTAGQTQWHKPGDPSLAPATTATAPADSAAFIPADAFSGPRPGYAYKQGTQGTGYYKDQGPMAHTGICMLCLLSESTLFCVQARSVCAEVSDN